MEVREESDKERWRGMGKECKATHIHQDSEETILFLILPFPLLPSSQCSRRDEALVPEDLLSHLAPRHYQPRSNHNLSPALRMQQTQGEPINPPFSSFVAHSFASFSVLLLLFLLRYLYYSFYILAFMLSI